MQNLYLKCLTQITRDSTKHVRFHLSTNTQNCVYETIQACSNCMITICIYLYFHTCNCLFNSTKFSIFAVLTDFVFLFLSFAWKKLCNHLECQLVYVLRKKLFHFYNLSWNSNTLKPMYFYQFTHLFDDNWLGFRSRASITYKIISFHILILDAIFLCFI